MSSKRIDQAIARINTAVERIDNACSRLESQQEESGDGQGSARVMALVNAHEKLREEVADTIGELDAVIEELES